MRDTRNVALPAASRKPPTPAGGSERTTPPSPPPSRTVAVHRCARARHSSYRPSLLLALPLAGHRARLRGPVGRGGECGRAVRLEERLMLGLGGRGRALGVVDVVREEELEEEDEVRGVHAQPKQRVEERDVARHPAREVDDGRDGHCDPKDHLGELQGRDEHREALGEVLGALARLRQPKVGVHDAVHGVVHRRKPEAGADPRRVSVPAEEQHGEVVVPVQKDDRGLAHQQEEGVEQLGQLRVDEQAHKQPRVPMPVRRRRVADRRVPAGG
mmetsp:Transcript_22362/g.71546  ORF Transcript_22362/g.71546 Transcript_22362/m.71546 type:complete len:272 (-) Transcript_22362:504-1319(-)